MDLAIAKFSISNKSLLQKLGVECPIKSNGTYSSPSD